MSTAQTNNAGRISSEWYDNALSNGTEADIRRAVEYQCNEHVDIDDDLTVWAHRRGIWLSQDQIDRICDAIG